MSPRAILVLPLVAGLVTAGCTRYEPVSLHGAGSMRVEVEVYRGPLSLSTDAQVGQLAGVLARRCVRWTIGGRK